MEFILSKDMVILMSITLIISIYVLFIVKVSTRIYFKVMRNKYGYTGTYHVLNVTHRGLAYENNIRQYLNKTLYNSKTDSIVFGDVSKDKNLNMVFAEHGTNSRYFKTWVEENIDIKVISNICLFKHIEISRYV